MKRLTVQMNKHLGSDFTEWSDEFCEKLAEDHVRLIKALERVTEQATKRGYPTGQEWDFLVKHAEKALKGGIDDAAD